MSNIKRKGRGERGGKKKIENFKFANAIVRKIKNHNFVIATVKNIKNKKLQLYHYYNTC
jgi:hypothetical protein